MALEKRRLEGLTIVSFHRTFTTTNGQKVSISIVNDAQQVPGMLINARKRAKQIHTFPGKLYLCLRVVHPDTRVRTSSGDERELEYAQVLDVASAAIFFKEVTPLDVYKSAVALVEQWNKLNGSAVMREHRINTEDRFKICEETWEPANSSGHNHFAVARAPTRNEHSRLELILSAYIATIKHRSDLECKIKPQDLTVQLKYKSTHRADGTCVSFDADVEDRMRYDGFAFTLDLFSWLELTRSDVFGEAIDQCASLAKDIDRKKQGLESKKKSRSVRNFVAPLPVKKTAATSKAVKQETSEEEDEEEEDDDEEEAQEEEEEIPSPAAFVEPTSAADEAGARDAAAALMPNKPPAKKRKRTDPRSSAAASSSSSAKTAGSSVKRARSSTAAGNFNLDGEDRDLHTPPPTHQ